jgi:hypothetical protein
MSGTSAPVCGSGPDPGVVDPEPLGCVVDTSHGGLARESLPVAPKALAGPKHGPEMSAVHTSTIVQALTRVIAIEDTVARAAPEAMPGHPR